MSVISATGIEPAADLRKALAERKRASLVPLVVLLDTDAEGAAGFRTPCASSTRGELFMATELVARGAADMFAVLLPWRRGRIQTLGMP